MKFQTVHVPLLYDKMSSAKRWGNAPFWGVSEDFDPQWTLDEEQKRVQQKLIDLCRTTLRPNAVSIQQYIISEYKYEYEGGLTPYGSQSTLLIQFNTIPDKTNCVVPRAKKDF